MPSVRGRHEGVGGGCVLHWVFGFNDSVLPRSLTIGKKHNKVIVVLNARCVMHCASSDNDGL